MNAEQWFSEQLENAKDSIDFITEDHILEFTEQIINRMNELDLSQKDLADRMNVKPPYVHKILNGNPNVSLKTMIKIAMALRCELSYFRLKPNYDYHSFNIDEFFKASMIEMKYDIHTAVNTLLEKEKWKTISKKSIDINESDKMFYLG